MLSIKKNMRVGVEFVNGKRKNKKNSSSGYDSWKKKMRNRGWGEFRSKRKRNHQEDQERNPFGDRKSMSQCFNFFCPTSYDYNNNYSTILRTWNRQLREPLDGRIIEENNKKSNPRKTKKVNGGGDSSSKGFVLQKCGRSSKGFVLHKCSVQVKIKKIKKGRLKDGDRVNLSKILFNKHRDFLITHDRSIHAKDLQGKVIILHFVPLVPWNDFMRRWVMSLVDIYHAIQPQGVEVVFIGVKIGESPDNHVSLKQSFEDKFCVMPWTAIPFPDVIKSQTYLEKKLRLAFSSFIGLSTFSVVIDPAGVVLRLDADVYIARYGARGCPFSDLRIHHLRYEDADVLKHPTITKLLTSPQCNYLINRYDEVVPVRHLENKVVAFYFYENYERDDLTQELKRAYKQLANKENFEIVLVYIHDSVDSYQLESEESFWETFQTMPWLALPYKDPRAKYLKRVLCYPLTLDGPLPDPRLVVIGPQGKFVEPYGVDILQNFGISAYPFTRKRVAELDAEYMRKLKLDTFLDSLSIQKYGYKVKVSQLVGKRIIFMIGDGWATLTNFCQRLKERYFQMKDTDDEFEVIHVPYRNSLLGEYVATLSWMTCSSLSDNDVLSRLFRQGEGLLAFNGDGRVVRRAMFPKIEGGNMDFPFYAGSLEEEAFTELIGHFMWDCFLNRVHIDC